MIGYASTRTLLAGAALALAALVPPTTAQAQGLSWLWGGGSQVGGSGKEVVRFGMQHRPGQVIVSFGDRRLYLVTRPGEALSYPIAVPREQSRWQGTLQVSSKRVDPPWTPTAEMLRENPKLPRHVPGGHPMNPMGARALYLGATLYRIHGTDAPWTIGQAVSKGCIRMYNRDVIDLYDRVPVGSRVTVTWNRYTTSSMPMASWGGGNRAVVDRTASRRTSETPSGFSSGFIFPWLDQEEPVRRRAERPRQRAQQKRPRPVSSRAAPKKQEQPVSSNTAPAAPVLQSASAY